MVRKHSRELYKQSRCHERADGDGTRRGRVFPHPFVQINREQLRGMSERRETMFVARHTTQRAGEILFAAPTAGRSPLLGASTDRAPLLHVENRSG